MGRSIRQASRRVRPLQDQFVWLNHTYSHMNLDNATFQQTYLEIIKQHRRGGNAKAGLGIM